MIDTKKLFWGTLIGVVTLLVAMLSILVVVTGFRWASGRGFFLLYSNLEEPISVTVDYITIRGVDYSTSITELDLTDIDDLKNEDIVSLEYMMNLESLHLSGGQVSDLAPLSNLTNLRVLHLSGNQISDLTPLTGLTGLSELQLNSNQISDVTPLAGLTNLSVLNLGGNEKISDLTPLTSLPSLTTLLLWGIPVNIATLSSFTGLASLDLRYCQLSDITPLAGLINLTELWLDGNQLIYDWSPVAHIYAVGGRP